MGSTTPCAYETAEPTRRIVRGVIARADRVDVGAEGPRVDGHDDGAHVEVVRGLVERGVRRRGQHDLGLARCRARARA